MTKVVNKYKEQYDVYIGRGSIWGNPYSHLDGTLAKYKVGSREEAIANYKSWLWNQMCSGNITKEQLLQLDGKTLGCYCKPKACHGDVIVAAIDWLKQQENM